MPEAQTSAERLAASLAAAPIALPWPAELPQCVQDWKEKNEPVVTRTAMEGGPPKVRRRYSAPIRVINASMILSDTQYPILRDFFDQALQGGVLHFLFTHPWSGEQLELRFAETPGYEALGPTSITCALVWEQIPS